MQQVEWLVVRHKLNDNSAMECVMFTIYPLSSSEELSLWKAMSASGNISVSFALQYSDVLPMFLMIKIRSVHGSVVQHDKTLSLGLSYSTNTTKHRKAPSIIHTFQSKWACEHGGRALYSTGEMDLFAVCGAYDAWQRFRVSNTAALLLHRFLLWQLKSH